MKKLILVVIAAFALTAGAYAQVDSTNRKMNQRDMNNQNENLQNQNIDKSHPDGIMMQNGKMMIVSNGQITTLDRDMIMINGTTVKRDGTWIKKDGTKIVMKEGQHIDMSGNMIPMKTYKDDNNQEKR